MNEKKRTISDATVYSDIKHEGWVAALNVLATEFYVKTNKPERYSYYCDILNSLDDSELEWLQTILQINCHITSLGHMMSHGDYDAIKDQLFEFLDEHTVVPDMNLFEEITPENVMDLKPGEWIWDNELIKRDEHRVCLNAKQIDEPIGFRLIRILNLKDAGGYYTKPFFLSSIDHGTSDFWTCLEPKRFYKFKKENSKNDSSND